MASAETVVLTLQEQISGPADAAAGGLSRLEQQILREQAALERLQERLAGAQGKLAGLAEGKVDLRAEAAFLRQEAAVERLEARLASARGALAAMGEADVPTEKLDAAERATARLEAQLANAKARMAEMGTPGGEVVNVAGYQRAQGAVDSLLLSIEAKQGKLDELAEKLNSTGDAATGAAGKIEEAASSVDAVAEPAGASSAAMGELGEASKRMMGETGEKLGKLTQFGEALAGLGPYGIAAAAGLAVLAAALVAVGKFFVAGVQASGQYRDEMLKIAGAMEGNVSAAKELQGTISAVSSASATSRDKITGFATSLANAGLQGAELKSALEAAAIASSAGGDQMANDFVKSAEAAKKAGQSVDELSKKMKDKLGGVAAAQALSFGVQVEKLKENLTGLFSGADITPLLTAMQALLSIFDATSASGQSMRTTIGAAIEGLIGIVLQAGIAMLKLYIAVKQNEAAWTTIKVVVAGIAAVFGLLAAALAIVVGGIAGAGALIIGPFVLAAGLVVEMISAIASAASSLWSAITSPIQTAKAWLSSLSLSSIGTDLIMGLINGIVGAGGGIGSSLTNIVKSGIAAAKSALGIASPSRVFADIGMNTGAGMVQGLDASADSVEESTSGLADAAITGAAAGKKAAGALAGGASSDVKGFAPTFSNCNFVGTTQREIEAMMRAVFEAEYLDSGAMA